MSDSRRQYRAIQQAVKQLCPEEPGGNRARPLDTLVALVSGIIASKRCPLPKIASQGPGHVHPDRWATQLRRWVQNETIPFDLYCLPFVQPWLGRLAAVRPWVLIMEGSAVARGCVTWLGSVIYARRAIPIGGWVLAGEKGHFPTATPLSLLRAVKAREPETARVIFLGDGELDSPELQAELAAYPWEYAGRTAKDIRIGVDDDWMSLAALPVTRGQRVFRQGAGFPQAADGPGMVMAGWGARYKEPIYLVSNLPSVHRACDWYRTRLPIETFCSDQKSRGFQLHRSHLSAPERVHRLMVAASLAYRWVIYLGTVAQEEDWLPVIHRSHRCDLSLFQLGLRVLNYLLNHDQPIPSSFALEPETVR